MRIVFCFVLVVFGFYAHSQTVSDRLKTAYANFEADSQLRAAISSLYVVDAQSGKVVFDKNSLIGLAPASTQKVITAATAYEILGKDFKYKTEVGYSGKIAKGYLEGGFYIKGSGDPTLGSWRFSSSTPTAFLNNFLKKVREAGITRKDTSKASIWVFDINKFSEEPYNGKWLWEDVANYYGIGSVSIDWHENQFDVILKPGKSEGDEVELLHTDPDYVARILQISTDLITGKKGSGDNTSFYLSPNSLGGLYNLHLTGTIPVGVDSFVVSASHPGPVDFFGEFLTHYNFEGHRTANFNEAICGNLAYFRGDSTHFHKSSFDRTPIYYHYSPSLDSICFWLLKKSINLYAEALFNSVASTFVTHDFVSTENGIEVITSFWKSKGIDPLELNIADGSGLSPTNRVTTHAEVQILQYAKKQAWFPGYYAGFPEYNGMKMKSGTIGGVKGYCGYHKSKQGKEYIFSFLVNNYNGPSSKLVEKMYKVLDELK